MEEKKTLLIVDDEKHTREGLRRALETHFDVYLAADLAGAKAILGTEPVDVVLTDLRLGGDNGMDVLDLCKAQRNPPVCFMMTAYGAVETAVEAMRRGAADYVTKPINLDKLEMLLLRAARGRQVEQENAQLREQLDRRFGLERLIGRSPAMEEIFEQIRLVADSRATVLIEGESGTGKELVAHAIHQLSPRKNKPFMAVHCKAFSQHLLESELFGHEKGAFTGAHERRIGRFEAARGGTLFLDEIGEIDESIQVKLLRVLGERTFERVGGNQPIQADVRVVAATNRNLEAMVKEGKFREDLFYRINVIRLHLPPLRERREDIPLLVEGLLKEICAENGKPLVQLSEEATRAVLEYDWPGNVRELRTALEHGVVLSRTGRIELKDLPPALRKGRMPSAPKTLRTLDLETLERQAILQALEENGQNRTEAAKVLGISRRTLHRKLHEYGLVTAGASDPEDDKD
ncbi:MAG: sigma-54 dependent transcriptional regulator [Candidatus Methylacidiphilales bacterium]